jgi:formylglycine-generating enzyme required for sulfatase activity
MKSEEIKNQFDRLEQDMRDGDMLRIRSRARALLNDLLKCVYTSVRGQASPAEMRDLLELEIELGGESGDFKEFEIGQMVDLFIRGRVADPMKKGIESALNLSAAVDLRTVARWLDLDGKEGGPATMAAARFVQAWLKLFANEAGILTPGEKASTPANFSSKPSARTAPDLPHEGQPYTDPITGMEFIYVPGGTFSMGDTFDEGVEDEKPVHEVRLSAFYMAACPVTQAQWISLMADNPSGVIAADHPVEQVTLADVMAFIDKLNAASPSGVRFDLPSEAQWEYAARSGGMNDRYAGGQDPRPVAWFEDNNTGGTAPVAGKAPNGLGLYDMSGNVWEWCRDIYNEDAYRQLAEVDPVCTRGGTDRVIRGGSWHLDAWSARCSRRFRFDPELFGPALGFRVVMVLVR